MTTPPAPTPDHRGTPLEVRGLTKSYGSFAAVDDLSFAVAPGRITGFLGPNGSGKTTTLRMLLGLARPSRGQALVEGVPYASLAVPQQVVGAALEATGFHPGRSGRNHLRVLADTAQVPAARVDEVLELVGMTAAADKRVGGYSLGMRQRLGLAAALVGDPRILVLDEPANGLDPEGIRWLREVLRHLAARGTSILVSSHLLAEVEQTVDDIVIINGGRLVRQGSVQELRGAPRARVRTSEPERLADALAAASLAVTRLPDGALEVAAPKPELVGDIAFRAGVPVHELVAHSSDLEQLYFDLTTAGADGPGRAGRAQAGQLPPTTTHPAGGPR